MEVGGVRVGEGVRSLTGIFQVENCYPWMYGIAKVMEKMCYQGDKARDSVACLHLIATILCSPRRQKCTPTSPPIGTGVSAALPSRGPGKRRTTRGNPR